MNKNEVWKKLNRLFRKDEDQNPEARYREQMNEAVRKESDPGTDRGELYELYKKLRSQAVRMVKTQDAAQWSGRLLHLASELAVSGKIPLEWRKDLTCGMSDVYAAGRETAALWNDVRAPLFSRAALCEDLEQRLDSAWGECADAGHRMQALMDTFRENREPWERLACARAMLRCGEEHGADPRGMALGHIMEAEALFIMGSWKESEEVLVSAEGTALSDRLCVDLGWLLAEVRLRLGKNAEAAASTRRGLEHAVHGTEGERTLREQLAEILTRLGDPEAMKLSLELAREAEASDDPAHSVRARERMGRAAMACGEWAEGAEWIMRALRELPDEKPGNLRTILLWQHWAECREHLGDSQGYSEGIEKALSFTTDEMVQTRAQLLSKILRIRLAAGETPEKEEDEILEILGRPEMPPSFAETLFHMLIQETEDAGRYEKAYTVALALDRWMASVGRKGKLDQARSMLMLGRLASLSGRDVEARMFLLRGLALYRDLNEPKEQAALTLELAQIDLRMGNGSDAMDIIAMGMAALENAGLSKEPIYGRLRDQRVEFFATSPDRRMAQSILCEVRKALEEEKDPNEKIFLLLDEARLLHGEDENAAAEASLTEAVRLCREVRPLHDLLTGRVYRLLGTVRMDMMDRTEDALQAYSRAEKSMSGLKAGRQELGGVLFDKGIAFRSTRDWTKAGECFLKAAELFKRNGKVTPPAAMCLFSAANMKILTGDFDEGQNLLDTARATWESFGNRYGNGRADCFLLQAMLYQNRGKTAQAYKTILEGIAFAEDPQNHAKGKLHDLEGFRNQLNELRTTVPPPKTGGKILRFPGNGEWNPREEYPDDDCDPNNGPGGESGPWDGSEDEFDPDDDPGDGPEDEFDPDDDPGDGPDPEDEE